MKTKFIALAAMMAMSISASAQFTNSSSTTSTKTVSDGWGTIFVEYNPLTAKTDVKGADDESISAFSAGCVQAFPISKGTPLYLEAGAALQYAYKNDWADVTDVNFSMVSVKVPVNLTYRFDLPNSTISILPYGGISLRGNITGSFTDKRGKKDKTYNVFDKKDVEDGNLSSDGKAWSRFQFGWQIGLKAMFNNSFMVGLGYGSDMSEISKKVTVSTTTITLGYCF